VQHVANSEKMKQLTTATVGYTTAALALGRGLDSSTCQLDLSRFVTEIAQLVPRKVPTLS